MNDLLRAEAIIKDWVENNKRGNSFEIKLPTQTQRMVKRAMGKGYNSHNITANGIAHGFNNHGENGKKLGPNSIPVRKEDAVLIPYIMTAPDRVEKGSTDIRNRESVRFYKNLSNGYIVVVEKEQMNSSDDMETINFWIEMSPEATNAQQNVVPDINVRNAILSSDVAKIRKDSETAIEKDVENSVKAQYSLQGNSMTEEEQRIVNEAKANGTFDASNPDIRYSLASDMARDAVMTALEGAGIDVEMATPEMVEDVLRARDTEFMSAKKRRALETAVQQKVGHSTVASSADGAKVLNNLDSLAKEYQENTVTHEKTFLGKVAEAIGVKFTVTTEMRRGNEEFTNFFTNRKPINKSLSNTAKQHGTTSQSVSADKGSEGNSDTQENSAKAQYSLQGNSMTEEEQRIVDEAKANGTFDASNPNIRYSLASDMARDAVMTALEGAGIDVEMATPEMVEDVLRARDGVQLSKRSEEREQTNRWIDEATAFVSGKSIKEVRQERIRKERERKELAKEIYENVLSGNFNEVTLQKINQYIDETTPRNPYGRRLSQRLPQRVEREMYENQRENAVDALYSRISESSVPANGRFSESGRREIESRKKEALKGWAIATGNWHTDLSAFTNQTEPIGVGTDSKVYISKDGQHVIKASKGKPYGKRFRPDIDNIPLFNSVFKNSAYEIVGYGEIDGEFVRILKQPIVDFANSTPLSEDERVKYMRSLGFEPLNKENTAFSNGEIVVSDLQKSNIVKDVYGNIRVIDADAKLHTKDVGGNYEYLPVEYDLPSAEFHIAYHGSGAKFDEFDHSHMGEGEGAQDFTQ